MLELVAMTKVKKRKPRLRIMPVLFGLSLSEFQDANNHKRWLSSWQTWTEPNGMNETWLSKWQKWAKCEGSIDFNDWVNALQLVGQINSLEYNLKLGEVKFREEIVKEICSWVPSGTRFEDSNIQGGSRLCKVIYERIKQSEVSSRFGVHVIGLYGFGGIGKTTFCKAMCNFLSQEYLGKVAHMELGSQREEDLLKDVLRRLTDMNLERLGAMHIDEYHNRLKEDMMNVKVFLTIDNVSSETKKQALTPLRAKYGPGSVVLVTARSLGELTPLEILASECMEMPELEMEEARSLFLCHAPCVLKTYLSNMDDQELVSSCVQRCYFKKGDGISHHYHPLALQVLGDQLNSIGYFPDRWRSRLEEIDYLNSSGASQHPVFSILRISFDAMDRKHQLLFMDVALFRPHIDLSFKLRIFDWIGFVHQISVAIVIERLENLKRRSLLANLGNGCENIGMHDLWREFARLETEAGKFKNKRCFVGDGSNALEEASVTNGGSINRMSLELLKPKVVDFSCFPNVTVLTVQLRYGNLQELNLTGLKHLKSLDLTGSGSNIKEGRTLFSLIGLSSLLNLGFLRWCGPPSGSPCIDEISRLTNLQMLYLQDCDRVPDLSNLILLQTACFLWEDSVATIAGFSSNHTNLQFLELRYCHGLESCPGVGELVALQELRIRVCSKLREVPNLQKLKQLRKLDVSGCKSLRGLPRLGDLVSLLELRAFDCSKLAELPDMRNLINLRILNLGYCELIKSLPGLNELVCLRSLDMSGCPIQEFPDLAKFPELLYVDVQDCVHLTKLTCTGPLNPQFFHLSVYGCMSLQALPDLTNSQRMEMLNVANSGVGLSVQLVEDMKARWPSMELIKEDNETDDDIDLITDEDNDDYSEVITDDDDSEVITDEADDIDLIT